MFLRTCKITKCLLVILLLLGIVCTSFGAEYYQVPYTWSFGNQCYLSFNQEMNFATSPYQGISYDRNLVGYWSMGEDAGSIVYDYSGNGNNGTATGANIVKGEYGDAMYLDGKSYVAIADSPSLRFGLSDFTLSAAFKLDVDGNGTYRTVLRKGITGLNPFYGIRINPSNNVEFILRDSPEPAHGYTLVSTTSVPFEEWVSVTATFSATARLCRLYINGVFNNQLLTENIGDVSSEKSLAIGRASDVSDQYFMGTIDNVRVYNCTLSDKEVVVLFTQPEQESFANYYSYTDSLTNNTMTINIDNLNENSNNTAFVICTNFFADNKLSFQANTSATMNVWTNLGQPVFTTGFWNSKNYTTTLTLDASSTCKIDWNSGTTPFSSNIGVSSTIAGKTAVFSALWSDNQSLSGGRYIFSTNNTGLWVNASLAPFASNSGWGNNTLTLNSTIGTILGFREYANNSLNLWGDSGIYAITTTNNTSVPSPTPSSPPTSSPTAITSPTPTPSLNPTTTSTPTPTTNKTNSFPTQTLLIATAVICSLVAVFTLALKKGYITVEFVDDASWKTVEDGDEGCEGESGDNPSDYTI